MDKKRTLIVGALIAGALVSLACWAYPMPGPNQETIVTYYSNAARTTEVGVRFIAKGEYCQIHHVDWGTQTAYSRVQILNCPNDPPPPMPWD